MTCPAGCVREKDHEGFHTTHPEIAKREDRAEYDRFIASLNAVYDRPSVAPPADEHYLEWHPYGAWLCSETITAVNRVGDRFIVATPTRCYSIIAEKSVCFNTPNQMFGMSRSTYYLLPRQPVSRPFVPLSGLEPRQSADPSRRATSR